MPRPKIEQDEILINAFTRLNASVMAQVREISERREWTMSKTLRKLIELGLLMESKDNPSSSRRPASRLVA